MKKCFMMLTVLTMCMTSMVIGQPVNAEDIPDIPVDVEGITEDVNTAVAVIGGDVTINDLIVLKPTIPNVDVVNLPKVKRNAFGIDVSEVLGDAPKVFRTTYASKNKFYGQDVMGDKGVYKWGINYDLSEYYEGLYFDMESTSPVSTYSENGDNASQYIYKMYQISTYNKGTKNELQVTVQETYYDLQKAELGSDGQELGIGVALTNMFVGDDYQIVPRIYYGQVWNLVLDDTGTTVNEYDGRVVVFGADYYRVVDEILFNFYAEATYTRGFDASDDELTHAQVGVSTDVVLDEGIIITPSVHYAHYFDDSITDDDSSGDVWCSIVMSYPF